MLHDMLLALWFFIPVATANMAPVLVMRISWLARFTVPMDGGRMFRRKRILGPNKTWRGLLSGIVVASVTLWVQQYAVQHNACLARFAADIDYAALPTLIVGPLFAIGALGGDAIKSFIKRQLGRPAGKPWPFFDQIGEILGGILVTLPFVEFSVAQYVWVIVIWIVGDLAVSGVAYLFGLKERPV